MQEPHSLSSSEKTFRQVVYIYSTVSIFINIKYTVKEGYEIMGKFMPRTQRTMQRFAKMMLPRVIL